MSWHDVPFLSFCFPPQIPSHNCIYFAEYILFLNLLFFSPPPPQWIVIQASTYLLLQEISFFWTVFAAMYILQRPQRFTYIEFILYDRWAGGGVKCSLILAGCFCFDRVYRLELNLNSVLGSGRHWSYFSANNGQIGRTNPCTHGPPPVLLWMCTPSLPWPPSPTHPLQEMNCWCPIV